MGFTLRAALAALAAHLGSLEVRLRHYASSFGCVFCG